MPRTYNRLSVEERIMIMQARREGLNVTQIAYRLERPKSTISRELRRAGPGRYEATAAQAAYRARHAKSRRPKLIREGTPLYAHVRDKLIDAQWSPEQIAADLHSMPAQERPGTVCAETIYTAIYARPTGALRLELIRHLRQAKKRRGNRRRTAAGASYVPAEQRIIQRPQDVAARAFPGHWEGDLIKGAYNRSAVGVLVERKTRYVVLCRMGGCTADDALAGYTRQMRKLPATMLKSMTYDRGAEMARHAELSARLDIAVWFCDPHAPWQRASNENTNGLLRQYLPKGTDLARHTQSQLNRIADKLNTRPRKTLGWKTPQELMAIELNKLMADGSGQK